MSKLLSILIATAFAATLSFNAVAAKHMGAAPAEAPKAEAAAKPAEAAKPAPKANKKHKKAKKSSAAPK
jgi:hypothetical protein